jgi:hypothetical protein
MEDKKWVGCVGMTLKRTVTMVYIFRTDSKYNPDNPFFSYIMEDEDGNTIVWKTETSMTVRIEQPVTPFYEIKKGDKIEISGIVKAHTEYKGEKQTVLTRCSYSLVEKGAPVESKAERDKREAQNLYKSLQEGDIIWTMPYKNYKEHYADCETIPGTYDKTYCTIDVLIRKGRLKNSGVRGKHFHCFVFQNTKTLKCVSLVAVCIENAEKRLKKDFPNSTWKYKERLY